MRISTIAATGAALLLVGCSAVPQLRPSQPVARAVPVARELPYRWTQGNAPKAHKDMVATFGRAGLSPGEFVWATEVPAAGDTEVVIDLLMQRTYAYRGGKLVGAASVSSAKRGMVTPLGFWSVLEKKKFHRSRKYDNAPMPFMQRIDEYGIALHGGVNPGYPASHGCIRLPMKFAEKLYALTDIGDTVYVEE